MRIAAFDISLTETGWARVSDDGSAASGVLNPPMKGMERLRWIRNEVMVLALDAQLVVIEGYSFNRNPSMWQLAELGGVIRYALWEVDIVPVVIPPSTLKKFATGKGNAKKEDMLAAAIRRLNYERANHNEADALFLLHAGAHLVGRPLVAFPQAQVDALSKLLPLEA